MRRLILCWMAAVLCSAGSVQAWAQAPACRDFSWDVHQERALFAGRPQAVQGGTTADATPTVRIDRFYQVQLAPQMQVKFVTPPGKVMLADGAYAGMVKFRVPHSGSYRVSLDAPFWIDVVAHGKLLATQDFSGSRCAGPHKMVIFDMPAGEDLWLQISGAHSAQAQIAVTTAPATQGPATQGPATHGPEAH